MYRCHLSPKKKKLSVLHNKLFLLFTQFLTFIIVFLLIVVITFYFLNVTETLNLYSHKKCYSHINKIQVP